MKLTNVDKVNAPLKQLSKISSRTMRDSRQTLGDGTTEKVFMMRSGYSSRILLINSVPMPDPVPPPSVADHKLSTESQRTHH